MRAGMTFMHCRQLLGTTLGTADRWSYEVNLSPCLEDLASCHFLELKDVQLALLTFPGASARACGFGSCAVRLLWGFGRKIQGAQAWLPCWWTTVCSHTV